MTVTLTEKQEEAKSTLASAARHILLYGGARSGKTWLILRAIATRALAAEHSKHAVMRAHFSHCKQSIVLDTFPKMMDQCFPGVYNYKDDYHKTDNYATFPNGSQIWFGGLDEKDRSEKLLGNEYSSMFLNEASQISWGSRNLAKTRLAEKAIAGITQKALKHKLYYDCNPPNMGHWLYRVFIQKLDPESRQALGAPDNYAAYGPMNPVDNLENLGEGFLEDLMDSPARQRARFLEGKFGSIADNALWTMEGIDKQRYIGKVDPIWHRIVVAVDPSGAGDTDNDDNDEIGIVVVALEQDGNAYVLEDLTCKAGPETWGKVATSAYERWSADVIVAEANYGGAMVEFVIKAARPGTPYKKITASRGKHVRAEPISALTEQGKVRFAGHFSLLEDELAAFTTSGYAGEGSPNRADAMIWAVSELFPGLTRKKRRTELKIEPYRQAVPGVM